MVKQKCECRPATGIGGMLLLALGIYFLVWGFIAQTSGAISWSSWNWNAGLLYLIGLFVLGVGHMLKHKGHGCCGMHGMNKIPLKK